MLPYDAAMLPPNYSVSGLIISALVLSVMVWRVLYHVELVRHFFKEKIRTIQCNVGKGVCNSSFSIGMYRRPDNNMMLEK